jgi:hypothetical protein
MVVSKVDVSHLEPEMLVLTCSILRLAIGFPFLFSCVLSCQL